jgi:signal peptidase II
MMVDAPPARTGARGGLRLSLLVAAAWFAVDQLTKTWALRNLQDQNVDLFWTLRLNLSFNSGMAFGQGRGLGPVIGVVALVVVVVLVVTLRRGGSTLGAVATGMVIGGAAGNVADRLFRAEDGLLSGPVVDFIDFQWWPIFNVADIGIVCGGLLLLVAAWRSDRP